jgi:hypothetical protein
MSTQIHAGGQVTKDPNAIEFFVVDWDAEHLAASVTLTTSTWTITGPDAVLTDDQPSILSGSRKTQVRLSAGTEGKRYTVTNRIVTNESPSQTKDASFRVLVQQE